MKDSDSTDEEWDAGSMGCGELVLQLSRKLKAMEAGQTLKVTALDSGAPEDLPAWCNLTGHILLKSAHPQYWIQKKNKKG
jgi:tRNA 2-thiouridine synthesizing protein A